VAPFVEERLSARRSSALARLGAPKRSQDAVERLSTQRRALRRSRALDHLATSSGTSGQTVAESATINDMDNHTSDEALANPYHDTTGRFAPKGAGSKGGGGGGGGGSGTDPDYDSKSAAQIVNEATGITGLGRAGDQAIARAGQQLEGGDHAGAAKSIKQAQDAAFERDAPTAYQNKLVDAHDKIVEEGGKR
jgi:hypothetical protein